VLMPDLPIDGLIHKDVAKDYTHCDCFIRQASWSAAEKPVPHGFQDLLRALPQRMWQCRIPESLKDHRHRGHGLRPDSRAFLSSPK
jgi:hypothetical protein